MSSPRRIAPLKLPPRDGAFVAIDFETANHDPESACAIGMVRVEDDVVVARESRLIRPPSRKFVFTYIHGITWEQVAREASFREVWSSLRQLCEGVDFIAAHNASFDERVLRACCASARLPAPDAGFECTVALARRVWSIYPTRLDVVAARLGIALRHHDAMSDADACARIVVLANDHGRRQHVRSAIPLGNRQVGGKRNAEQ